MADSDMTVDEDAIAKFLAESRGVKSYISRVTNQIWRRAASMSSGFRSGYYRDERRGHVVGGTYARYGHDVRSTGRGPVGLVWTDNYAAILDNAKNNTLLKAR